MPFLPGTESDKMPSNWNGCFMLVFTHVGRCTQPLPGIQLH